MKKINGFTLIELLAIIVILAIIAVITVPLILGIIDDAKLNSITDSAYGYRSAIQNYSVYLQTVDSTNPGLKGSYTVAELKAAGLEVSGEEPNDGIILIDNEGISGCLKYDEYASYLYNNEIINTTKGNCPPEKLVTTGEGLYKSKTKPGRLIYRGANPDNRIFLKEDETNNTLYRIISYETDGTIKVVRDEKLSADMAWDSRTNESTGPRHNSYNTYCNYSGIYYGCNVWGNMNNTYYNGESLGNNFYYSYYNSATATTLTNEGSGTVTDESTLNKYLNGTWLTSINISDYIDNHNFNVGGVYYTKTYTNGDKGLQKEKEEEGLHTWTGKVGLLNITEYAEASLNENCDVFTNNAYNPIHYYQDEGASSATIHTPSTGWPCAQSNWTFKTYNQWTLSPYWYYRYGVWYVNSLGYFSSHGAYNATISVRPAFYLKSSINLSGTGSLNDEYTIVE